MKPGEHLDLSSEPSRPERPASASNDSASRPFIGVQFACCHVYSRIYINRDATAYEGRCPRCAAAVRMRIDPDGSTERFFTAY